MVHAVFLLSLFSGSHCPKTDGCRREQESNYYNLTTAAVLQSGWRLHESLKKCAKHQTPHSLSATDSPCHQQQPPPFNALHFADIMFESARQPLVYLIGLVRSYLVRIPHEVVRLEVVRQPARAVNENIWFPTAAMLGVDEQVVPLAVEGQARHRVRGDRAPHHVRDLDAVDRVDLAAARGLDYFDATQRRHPAREHRVIGRARDVARSRLRRRQLHIIVDNILRIRRRRRTSALVEFFGDIINFDTHRVRRRRRTSARIASRAIIGVHDRSARITRGVRGTR